MKERFGIFYIQQFINPDCFIYKNVLSMEDKLVTLAIHTFEKAQILKTILETEGIEVYIHNVNQIQPVVSAGVRVRIKESDLPHALRIIEDNKWFEEPKEEEAKVNAVKKVLIPIDFSDYSAKACELGINYAHAVGAEVMIMHAYFSPYFPSAIPMGDTFGLPSKRGGIRTAYLTTCPYRYGEYLYAYQPEDVLW